MIDIKPIHPKTGSYTSVASRSDALAGNYTSGPALSVAPGSYVSLEASPSTRVVGTYVVSYGSRPPSGVSARQAVVAARGAYASQALGAVR